MKFEEPQIFNRPRSGAEGRKPMSEARKVAEALFAKPKKKDEENIGLEEKKKVAKPHKLI